MKRIFCIIMFFVCSISFGQLTPISEQYKKEVPDLYNSIKEYAINKWEDDHQMIVYEINQQTEAFTKLGSYISINKENETFQKIAIKAMTKWSNGDISDVNNNSTIDWTMVLYEVENEVKAANSY